MHDPNEPNQPPRDINEPPAHDDPRASGDSDSIPELSAPELQAVEAQWARLQPRVDRLDRDRLLFLAGQAAADFPETTATPARLPAWVWPTSFAGMTAVAAALLCILILRPEPQVVERLVYVGPTGERTTEHSSGRNGQGSIFASPDMPSRSAAPDTWTVARLLRGGEELLASLPLADANAANSDSNFDPPERRTILSSRSLNALRDEDATSRRPPPAPKSRQPQSQYTQPTGIHS